MRPPAIETSSRRRRRATGFSLVEIAMVLAIAGTIIASVMLFFGTASLGEKTEETLQEMVLIQGIVHSIYAGQPTYAGLTGAVVASSSQMPSKWVQGTNLVGPFGGITVNPGAYTNNQFQIGVYGMTAQACQKLVTSDFGPTLAKVTLGSNIVQGGPMPVSLAQQNCPASGAVAGWDFN